MFTRGPSLSIRKYVSMMFIHSAFCYDLSIPIFFSKIFFAYFASGCRYGFAHSPLIVNTIFFRCLGTSCFVYIVCSCLGIFLVFLLSLFFGWSHQIIFFVLAAVLFSVSSEFFLMFRFSSLACCRSLFMCDSSLSSLAGFHPDFFGFDCPPVLVP